MKTIAALTTFGVLALASAGTSGARGELGPTPGQPDPARVVLRSTDLGGARVVDQGYYHEQGFVISYSRTFTMARAGGTPLMVLDSDAGLAQPGSDIKQAVGYFRRQIHASAFPFEAANLVDVGEVSGESQHDLHFGGLDSVVLDSKLLVTDSTP